MKRVVKRYGSDTDNVRFAPICDHAAMGNGIEQALVSVLNPDRKLAASLLPIARGDHFDSIRFEVVEERLQISG